VLDPIRRGLILCLQAQLHPAGTGMVMGAPWAAAAAALLLLWSPTTQPIPSYQLEIVAGAERTERGATQVAGALVYRAGGPFELSLRPQSRTQGQLTAKVYFSDHFLMLIHRQRKLQKAPTRKTPQPIKRLLPRKYFIPPRASQSLKAMCLSPKVARAFLATPCVLTTATMNWMFKEM